MNTEMIELAKRAVACKDWRWMPGMLTSDGGRVRAIWPSRIVWDYLNDFGSDHASTRTESVNVLPDLTDPATLGCLLALVREVRAAPRALVRLSSNGKSFHVFDVDRVTTGGNWAAWLSDDRCPSEAHALVAALEAK